MCRMIFSILWLSIALTGVNCFASNIAVAASHIGKHSKLFLSGGSTETAEPTATTVQSVPKKLKLIYFDAKGAGELSRVLMHVGGLSFEDFRYPIVPKEGGGFDIDEFKADKTAEKFSTNMDRIPLLHVEVNGKECKIGQSRSIERYVSSICNLMGKGEEEAAIIDCIAENVRDIKDKFGKIRMLGGFGSNPEKDKAMEAWFAGGELAGWLQKLEKSLPTGSSEAHAVGDSITYADVCIWYLLAEFFYVSGADSKAVSSAIAKAKCTRLSKISQRVGELPALKKWLEGRPATLF